jgi:hypothetical protein
VHATPVARDSNFSEVGGPTPETDRDRALLADIEAQGWHVVDVPELNLQPGWGFTVGLARSFEHPEIVVFGLPETRNRLLLQTLAARVAEGEVIRAGDTKTDILPGLRCTIHPVAKAWYEPLLGYAEWFHSGRAFEVIQVRWPDPLGRIPGEPGCDPEIASLQPRLELATAHEAGAEGLLHAFDIH